MSAIHDSITELIFNTPLVRAPHYLKAAGAPDADIALKLEYFNPAGSVKDRIALAMITDAEKRGVLKPGGTIIEPSSGNTGIGLAAVGTARGYKVKVVLPASLSVERRALIQAYGGEVILTPGPLAIKGSIAYAKQLHEADPSSVILGQFDNPANPEIHYKTTGPEIWKDTDGTVDVFIAGIGTGGTLSGAGKYLKEQKPDLKVIGIEPAKSPILEGGKPGPHGIQGIGTGFVPNTLDRSVYDEVVGITDEDSIAQARLLGTAEGIFVGISSGAALTAALQIAARDEYKGKRIVALLPDSGDRYLSTALGQFPELTVHEDVEL
ncbi:cysteine synthase A [Propionibacterium freudenreichii]|uniref:cysteine synthase A n=1 Tax=Propionibacterium freudenreichii TaxID=1744 RepID=UPI0005443D9B|nr:cysteine synthase A [Propionibacterium freudenreichii]AJQ91270.1 Cysteine synthase [Propionibacterium freudenreichii subsp. freudenreichii]MDK9343298.1 cysteine synthase A [Propionibacterium freudenreichii]MDK9347164.1 cysteine synthase A [Propionibacterium freudenreichii]CEG91767.1 cysteine synthase 2 [Propionibacterium freudenreichii]SBM42833.1 Cysteine synthase [Propionibacterium freudenreichii]